MKIWKYGLFVNGRTQLIEVPGAGEPKVIAVKAAESGGTINVWIEVHPEPETDEKLVLEFIVVGTGQRVDRAATYVGTAFNDTFGLVWHVYQVFD